MEMESSKKSNVDSTVQKDSTISESSPLTKEEEEEDRQRLQNIFNDLANGKKYVVAKDLLNWDFILHMYNNVSRVYCILFSE